MDDFIFGTLASDEQRLAHVLKRRGGIVHQHARTPRDPKPGEEISLELTVGPVQPAGYCTANDHAWVYWTNDGRDPEGENGLSPGGNVTPMQPAEVEWEPLLWGYVQHYRAALPPQAAGTLIRYRLSVSSAEHPAPDAPTEIFADQEAYYGCWIADDPPPDWTQRAIIYQIFVDRFHPGSNRQWQKPATPAGFYGGRLAGITENLDYITQLGANTLWLSPIFPSTSHHGYDATDYFDIEPRLGTKDDLRHLLSEAHARGMRLLLDFVPNHWSSQHPTFQQAITNKNSPYRDWYTFKHWPDKYETFFGVRSLPQLNLRHPAARQHVLEVAAYWLDFGVDGYRLDYAIGPTPDFWADFRKTTRERRPDCWTFGEVVEPSDRQLQFEGALDGCLDFILLEGFRQAFAFEKWTARRLAAFLDRHEAYFPATFARPSFLDNHDMNRFLWAARGDKRRLKLAALCQFTLAGQPVIYYGTEVGLSQNKDVRQGDWGLPEESRLPMLWGEAQDAALLDFYRRLIALRLQEPALYAGVRRNIAVDDHILAYARELEDRSLAIALNLSQTIRQVTLQGPWKSQLLATDSNCRVINANDLVLVELPALAGVVVGV